MLNLGHTMGGKGFFEPADLSGYTAEYNSMLEYTIINNDGTNLTPYSADPTQWYSGGRASLTSGQADPFGGTDAVLVIETIASGSHYTRPANATVVDATLYTNKLYIHPEGRTKYELRCYTALGWSSPDGTVLLTLTGTGTIETDTTEGVTVAPYGTDGWYEVSINEYSGSTTVRLHIGLRDDAGNISYTGDGSSGARVFCPMIAEPADVSPTYVTTGSSAEYINDMSQWDDVSGNGYHISEATVVKKPTWVDTESGVYFAGNENLSNTGFPQFTEIEIFAVVERKGVLTNAGTIAKCNNEFWLRMENTAHHLNFYVHDGTSYKSSSTGVVVPIDSPILANAWFDETQRYVDDNNGNSDLDAAVYVMNSATTTFDVGGVGSDSTDHKIYHLIIFEGKRTDTERVDIIEYMQNLWNTFFP